MSRGKRTSSCNAVLLLLCTALVLSSATNETKTNSPTCALQCGKVPHERNETQCTLRADPNKLIFCRETYSSILPNVSSLDLSNNKLSKIPTWLFPFCKGLTKLSLSGNNIKGIKPGTFKYLGALKLLNLSFNHLREWKVDPKNELQSLNYLDVTGNEHWLPNEQLLQLKNLKTVTWTKYCENCSLVNLRSNTAVGNSTPESTCPHYERYSSPSGWWWHDQIQYGKALSLIEVGFWPTCLCDRVCLTHQYKLPYFTTVGDIVIKARCSLYATGSVALLVNITVILVVAFHRSLRGDLSVCLVLNIAVCDVLIGLFSVLYAGATHIKSLYETLEGKHYYAIKFIKFTNIMGPILTCAVVSQVNGSFILTLEKFLKILFATKAHIRIGKRCVICFLSVVWSLSAIFAILPVFNAGDITYYNGLVARTPFPTDQLHKSTKKPIGIATGMQILLLIIQLTSFVLYIPIFIVAKQSGANVGIRREATIAKKIALLVFTNLIFFTAPVVLSYFQHNIWQIMSTNWHKHTVTEFQWLVFGFDVLPILCVSINSVLNPFLYAFRHPRIKQELDTMLSRCINVLRECFMSLREHLHYHSNRVQQENDMEMEEVN